jgi:hypothetical protein
MSGIYPNSGVPASDAKNTVDVPSVAGCAELFYSTSRCVPRFDPAQANAVISEMLNVMACASMPYDCNRLDNLCRAIRSMLPVLPPFLTTSLDYYVNAATGSDTLYDGTTATISGAHGPWATIDHALAVTGLFNLNGFSIRIHVASGVYGPINTAGVIGNGTVYILGDLATPANCIINQTGGGGNGNAITLNGVGGGGYCIAGFKVTNTGGGNGITVVTGSHSIYNIDHGFVTLNQIYLQNGSTLVYGPAGALATVTQTISGSYGNFLVVINGSRYLTSINPILNITASVGGASAVWCLLVQLSLAQPRYASITGAGNVTGYKYSATQNSVVDTNGQSTSYLPGTIAGVTGSGGQYT